MGKSRAAKDLEPPAAPDTEGLGREWEERKKFFHGVSIYKDVAKWAAEIANDRDTNIAALLDPVLRPWLWQEYRAMLDKKQREAQGREPPAPPRLQES